MQGNNTSNILHTENNRILLINEACLDILRRLLDSSSTIDEIAEVFLDKSKKLTGSKYGYINTIDPETGIATSRTISKMMGKDCNTSGKDKRITFPPRKDSKYPSLWGFALNEKKSFYTNNPKNHFSSKGIPKGHVPIENFLSVPVIYENILIGQVALANSKTGYSNTDIEIIEKLKDLYIIAIKIKEAEQDRDSLREKYETIFENMYEGLWQIDKNAITVFVNSKMAEMLGYTVEEMTGKHLFEFMDDNWKKIAEEKLGMRKSGIKEIHDFEFIKKDGSKIFTRLATAPIFDKNGNFNGAIATITDITEKKHIEEKLRKSEYEKSLILNSMTEMFAYYNLDLEILWANKASADSINMKLLDLVGKHCYELWHQRKSPCKLCPVLKSLKTKKPQEAIVTTPDGRVWLLKGYPVLNENNEVVSLFELGQDITNQIKTEKQLKQSYKQIKKTLKETINMISSILEIRDPYTENHQRNVAKLCRAMALELGMDKEKIELLYTAALIHDIGKIAIPQSILSKPSGLTEIEKTMIHTHSQVGYEILSKIDFGYPLQEIILQHHERIDGSGYPNALKGTNILLEAKVLAVADTVEAMANHRPYRAAYGIDKALREINSKKGILFDESAVNACIAVFKQRKFEF
mgnify:CR=1 FL=1